MDWRVTALLVMCSCAAPPETARLAATLDAIAQEQKAEQWTPPAPQPEKSDWIKLKSGEWLKGRITVLRDDKLEFDSDELDDLTFDWKDVHELHSPITNSMLFDDHIVVVGSVTIVDGEVIVQTPEGERRFHRDQLQTLISGDPSRANYWSGKLSLGGSWRNGNVNQTTVNGIFSATRRTVQSRGEVDYNGSFSELEGVENANNHRLNSKYDYFVNRRFYVTAISLELFSDPFQNISLRVTPATGVGYTVVKTGKLDWDVGGGVGYQWTKSQTVEAGNDRESANLAAIVNTSLSWDVTQKIELSVNYNNQIGIPETKNTNMYFFTELDIDVLGPLDLNLAFTWWRTGNPQPDSDGVTPLKDDTRFTVGLALDF